MKILLHLTILFTTYFLLTSCSQNKLEAAEATLAANELLELSGTTWVDS